MGVKPDVLQIWSEKRLTFISFRLLNRKQHTNKTRTVLHTTNYT